MENDIQTLMNVFQRVKNVNFEYMRKGNQANFLFVRDGDYIIRFIFDDTDSLKDIKIVGIKTNELSKKED